MRGSLSTRSVLLTGNAVKRHPGLPLSEEEAPHREAVEGREAERLTGRKPVLAVPADMRYLGPDPLVFRQPQPLAVVLAQRFLIGALF